jgi:hypothetical protein
MGHKGQGGGNSQTDCRPWLIDKGRLSRDRVESIADEIQGLINGLRNMRRRKYGEILMDKNIVGVQSTFELAHEATTILGPARMELTFHVRIHIPSPSVARLACGYGQKARSRWDW